MPDGSLWSRTRKRITGVPHIERAVAALGLPCPADGELYNHQYRNNFEDLTSYIRRATPVAGAEIVQYHVYDIAHSRATFRERVDLLRTFAARATRDAIGSRCYTGPLVLVETRWVDNEDELMLAFEDFLAKGYEGAIARNADGLYVNKRSYDLLKIKQFDDSEFPCVGVEEGKGKMAGHAIFVCRTSEGAEFRAKMKGDHSVLAKFLEHPELVVGKQVTVKYQGLTNKNGVPRFPVALRIREEA